MPDWSDALPSWYRTGPIGPDYYARGLESGLAVSQFGFRKALAQKQQDLAEREFQLNQVNVLGSLEMKKLDYDMKFQKMNSWMDSMSAASSWMGLPDDVKLATPPPAVTDPRVGAEIQRDRNQVLQRKLKVQEDAVKAREAQQRIELQTQVLDARQAALDAQKALSEQRTETEKERARVLSEKLPPADMAILEAKKKELENVNKAIVEFETKTGITERTGFLGFGKERNKPEYDALLKRQQALEAEIRHSGGSVREPKEGEAVPKDKSDLVVDRIYKINDVLWRWDGTKFVEVMP